MIRWNGGTISENDWHSADHWRLQYMFKASTSTWAFACKIKPWTISSIKILRSLSSPNHLYMGLTMCFNFDYAQRNSIVMFAALSLSFFACLVMFVLLLKNIWTIFRTIVWVYFIQCAASSALFLLYS